MNMSKIFDDVTKFSHFPSGAVIFMDGDYDEHLRFINDVVKSDICSI